jgi:hypothetical protein
LDNFGKILVTDQQTIIDYIHYLENKKYKNEVEKKALEDFKGIAERYSSIILNVYFPGGGIIA